SVHGTNSFGMFARQRGMEFGDDVVDFSLRLLLEQPPFRVRLLTAARASPPRSRTAVAAVRARKKQARIRRSCWHQREKRSQPAIDCVVQVLSRFGTSATRSNRE